MEVVPLVVLVSGAPAGLPELEWWLLGSAEPAGWMVLHACNVPLAADELGLLPPRMLAATPTWRSGPSPEHMNKARVRLLSAFQGARNRESISALVI